MLMISPLQLSKPLQLWSWKRRAYFPVHTFTVALSLWGTDFFEWPQDREKRKRSVNRSVFFMV
jgi:hypothetical protein